MIPPIAIHHSLFLTAQKDAEEKRKARQEGRLPQELTPFRRGAELPETCNSRTAIVYLLTDVLYQILFELCEQMQERGLDFKHDAKRRFNELFRAAKAFRAAANRANLEVFKLSEQTVESYFEDTQWFREVIELIYDRSMGTRDAHDRIRALIFNLPKGEK